MRSGRPRGSADAFVCEIHVTPRAARTEWAGSQGGRPRLRVAAPPVDGRANDEVRRFLAEWFGVPRSAVRIEAGASGRIKRVSVTGPAAAACAVKWPPPEKAARPA